MKTNEQMLSSILKTTQMGQSGIRSVLDTAKNPELQMVLKSQLKEYDSIEDEAHTIASGRGWVLPELSAATRIMSNVMTRMKLMAGDPDPKIAGMMIQGNTRGMITGLKDQHQWKGTDSPIHNLSQKLIDTENANIQQMKPYL